MNKMIPNRPLAKSVYATTPGLPAFAYRAIGRTRLWHGRNPLTASDVEALRAVGITHLLDLREPHEWGVRSSFVGGEAVAALTAPETGIVRENIAIGDGGVPTPKQFAAGCAFIENALHGNPDARVYVHCRMGLQRTAAILAAYYARAHGITAHEALNTLNEQGAILDPTAAQLRATREWISEQTTD